MITLYCEGKYDSIYLARLLTYFKIDDVNLVPLNGKNAVIGKYKKNETKVFYAIDYDNGISKKNIKIIEKNPEKFIVFKVHFEHYIHDLEDSCITDKQKKIYSSDFNSSTDEEIDLLFASAKAASITEILSNTGTSSGSNFLEIIEIIKNSVSRQDFIVLKLK